MMQNIKNKNTMKNLRKNYTLGEWIDLLISNLLGDVKVDEANKLHLIALLIPLVEKNYFLLHSSAIGKMLCGETTPFGTEISKPLSAAKFVKLLRNQPEVISFNVPNEKYIDNDNTANMLKDYMFSGSVFSKRSEITTGASMIFWTEAGLQSNTQNKKNKGMTNEPSFLDRIYCYVPAFDLNKDTQEVSLGKNPLFNDLLDYFKEARKEDFTEIISHYFLLGKELEIRNLKAIKKTVSGLVKLLFPDGEFNKEEIRLCLDYAIKGRELIREYLFNQYPDFFNEIKFGYSER